MKNKTIYKIGIMKFLYSFATLLIFPSKSMPETIENDVNEQLEDYKRLLDSLSLPNAEPQTIPNSGKQHAALLMSKLFQLTERSANMVVGDFCGDVSDNNEYLQSLESALNKGVQFNVLILNKDSLNKTSKALEILTKYHNKGANIYFGNEKVKREIRNILKSTTVDFHFSYFDNTKFRLEINPEQYTAIGGFKHAQVVTLLKETFDNALKHATPYSC